MTAPVAVDPGRLASGRWDHKLNRQIGQGDIYASYSAERIAYGQPVRRPFIWKGALRISVGNAIPHGPDSAQTYRLGLPEQLGVTPQTYREKTLTGEAARRDPNGFYHGMLVRHGGRDMVLIGPPVVFVPGEIEQPDLFG